MQLYFLILVIVKSVLNALRFTSKPPVLSLSCLPWVKPMGACRMIDRRAVWRVLWQKLLLVY